MPRPLTRRDAIRTLSLASVSVFGSKLFSQSPDSPSGLIVRMQEPRNLETPPDGLVPWKTATEQFYVRSHFALPKIDRDQYRLTVTGHVEQELSLSLKELQETAKIRKPLTLECAGNGRVYLSPAVPGLQWGNGGVSNAEWTGVPLGAILERAKVKTGAVDVVLIGADSGTIAGPPSSPGVISFDRGIPLEKAKRDESLLVTQMNGEPLTASHGAPLRAVIGGWYGVSSVKWLTKIVVTDKPYRGFWETLDYSRWDRSTGTPSLIPLTAGLPKAIIVKPGLNAVLPARSDVTVSGKTWAGERTVVNVEISEDGGKSWHLAKLANDEKEFCWRDWSYVWKTGAPGPKSLLARCTDDRGNTQQATRDANWRSYGINHLIPCDLTVKG